MVQAAFNKGKQSLIAKAMKLSVKCDVDVFLVIYDRAQERAIHFSSDEQLDVLDIFNSEAGREFYSLNHVSINPGIHTFTCSWTLLV